MQIRLRQIFPLLVAVVFISESTLAYSDDSKAAKSKYDICVLTGSTKLTSKLRESYSDEKHPYNIKYIDRSSSFFSSQACDLTKKGCDVVFIVPSAFSTADWASLFTSFCNLNCASEIRKMLDVVLIDENPAEYAASFQNAFKSPEGPMEVKLARVNPYSEKELDTFLKNYVGNVAKYTAFLERKAVTKAVTQVENLTNTLAGKKKETASYSTDGVSSCMVEAQKPAQKLYACEFLASTAGQSGSMKKRFDFLKAPDFKKDFYLSSALAFGLGGLGYGGLGVFGDADKERVQAKTEELFKISQDPSLSFKQRTIIADLGLNMKENMSMDRYVSGRSDQKLLKKVLHPILEALNKKAIDSNYKEYLCRSITHFLGEALTLDQIPKGAFSDPNSIEVLGCLGVKGLEKTLHKLLASGDNKIRMASLNAFLGLLKSSFRAGPISLPPVDLLFQLAFGPDPEISETATSLLEKKNLMTSFDPVADQLLLKHLKSKDLGTIRKAMQLVNSWWPANQDVYEQLCDSLFELAQNAKDSSIRQDAFSALIRLNPASFEHFVRMRQLYEENKDLFSVQQLVKSAPYSAKLRSISPEDELQVKYTLLSDLKKERDPERKKHFWQGLFNRFGEVYTRQSFLLNNDNNNDEERAIFDELLLIYKKAPLDWQYSILSDGIYPKSIDSNLFLVREMNSFEKRYLREKEVNPQFELKNADADPIVSLKKSILSRLFFVRDTSVDFFPEVFPYLDSSDDELKKEAWDVLSRSQVMDPEVVSVANYVGGGASQNMDEDGYQYQEAPSRRPSERNLAITKFETGMLSMINKFSNRDQRDVLMQLLRSYYPKSEKLKNIVLDQMIEELSTPQKEKAHAQSVVFNALNLERKSSLLNNGFKKTFTKKTVDKIKSLSADDQEKLFSKFSAEAASCLIEDQNGRSLFLKIFAGKNEALAKKAASFLDSYLNSPIGTKEVKEELRQRIEEIKEEKALSQDLKRKGN